MLNIRISQFYNINGLKNQMSACFLLEPHWERGGGGGVKGSKIM